jgi:thiamine biosynthesis lipoprotein ApbE
LDHHPIILNDNQSGIAVLNSGNFNSDSRHMRLRYHHLVDAVKNHLLEVTSISTNEMKADGFTKALDGTKHRAFVKMMGMG